MSSRLPYSLLFLVLSLSCVYAQETKSDLHTRWGLDHRNGMDVGLHPDSVEGRALIEFLRAESIPFLVFRGPVPGVATGPHIHIGMPSHRY